MCRHTTNQSRVVADHTEPTRYELWNTTMNETQPNWSALSHGRDLLSHAAGVTGRVPAQLKKVGHGYVHHNKNNTTEAVDLGDEPVDRALQLTKNVDSGTTCEICFESRDAAMQLIEYLVDHPSVMLEVAVEVYYSNNGSDSEGFDRFVVAPSGQQLASLAHAVETFSEEYTTAAETDSIDMAEFVDRFRMWHLNLTGTEPARSEVGSALQATLEDITTSTSNNQQDPVTKQRDRIIEQRRWIDDLQSN